MTLSNGKKVHNAIRNQNPISLYSSNDYIFREFNLSLSELCTAVGIGISVAQLVGILLSYGLSTVVTIGLKDVIKAAVGLSIAFGGLVNNRGIVLKMKCYKKTVCRGSECFTGYYDCKYYSHSIY